MNLLDKAIMVSAKAHHNQFRKGTDLPYISHPYAVGMILMKHGCSDEVIAAGILHDTVEDTSLSIHDIKDSFGEAVATIVAGCSEPNKNLSWEDRKQHTIEFLKTASLEIRLVSCADKLHNISSMRKNERVEGEAFWNRFNRGKEKQAWYYRNVVKSLGEQGNFPMLEELAEEVELLFS